MKIIEAMKRIKNNKEKVVDLQNKIGLHCANLNHETPLYGTETKSKIEEWAQSCTDLSKENIRLLCAIQRTNIKNQVTITLSGIPVTKTIAEWVWRKREYAATDLKTWALMTDRNLKEGVVSSSTSIPVELKIQRHFDPELRDEKMAIYRSEPHEIDSALEIVNATTDLEE